MLFLGSSYPQPPRIGYRVPAFVSLREFGGPMSDYSEKWDAFDYLTVAGALCFSGDWARRWSVPLDVALSSSPPGWRVLRPRHTAPAEMALLQPGLITEGRIG